jgi:phosphotransferase system  glucose/maltose/N-acetylglucosamine-specific IIC component
VLPDGLFSNQKSQFWSNLEGHGLENLVIFYDHFKYFMANWYKLLPFGIFCGYLVFFTFWYVWTKKNLATLGEVSVSIIPG